MIKHTIFYKKHQELGAKTGEFAGYDMPLYYGEGALAEHHWVRSSAGLFDVSHMGQVFVEGEDAQAFLQKLTPSYFDSAPPGRAKYTVLLNEKGGIIDDLIITKLSDDRFFLVINAGRKDVDLAYFEDQASSFADVSLNYLGERGLLALQGPEAERVMKDALGIDCSSHPYMWFEAYDDIYVSRLGYTGEDGFEVSVDEEKAAALWDKLIAHDAVKPAGLACRDTLRLEVGYPLYGHDLNEETTPVEANLGWVVSKNNDSCYANDVLKAQKNDGTERLRMCVKLLEKGIAREGTEIVSDKGDVIGALTSGGYSPSCDYGVGQGYIEKEYAKPGTKITLRVRRREIKAEVAPLFLVEPKTKSMKKQEKDQKQYG